MTNNPLAGWKIERQNVQTLGRDLKRPECILAERSGDLWVADARGGVMHIGADGAQNLVAPKADSHFESSASFQERFARGTLPNGLAFTRDGDLLIANFGTDALELMTRDGRCRTLCDRIDGQPLGKVNFVLRDSRDRLWITVSTRTNPWTSAMRKDLADGYIAVLDGQGLRIVAEGFAFTNEVRLDAREEWLYVVETTGKRISRLRIQKDASLTNREIFGPADLGAGFPDGIAFDAFGNLWVTMVMADRLLAITPQGEVLELLDDGDPAATQALERHFASGTLTTEIMAAAHGTIAPWLASVTFGGRDLRTVYLGSLLGTTVPYVSVPVSGLPMVHW